MGGSKSFGNSKTQKPETSQHSSVFLLISRAFVNAKVEIESADTTFGFVGSEQIEKHGATKKPLDGPHYTRIAKLSTVPPSCGSLSHEAAYHGKAFVGLIELLDCQALPLTWREGEEYQTDFFLSGGGQVD